MKKVWSFLKSMRFGVVLLICIGLLCVAGTLVDQGLEAEQYVETYGEFWGGVITKTGADHMFSTWYFAAFFGLLGLNLLFCSFNRIRNVGKIRKALLASAQKKDDLPLRMARGAERAGEIRLKNGIGLYGSLITHLSMLLLIVTAVCVFTLQTSTEYEICVGESQKLSDGTTITVNDFSMEDSDGKTDYISNVTVTTPDGTSTEKTLEVNYPYKSGDYTVYQDSYNIDLSTVKIYTDDYPTPETLEVDGETFLSIDGENGVTLISIYGDYQIAEDGQYEAYNYMDGSIKRPIYLIKTTNDGEDTTGLVLPGTTISAGGVYVTLPSYHPVLKVKYLPGIIMPLMYTSFVLLICGLYLCFFRVPCAVRLTKNEKEYAAYIEAHNEYK